MQVARKTELEEMMMYDSTKVILILVNVSVKTRQQTVIRDAGSSAASTGRGAGEDAAGSQGAGQVGPHAVHKVQWHCAVCRGQIKRACFSHSTRILY